MDNNKEKKRLIRQEIKSKRQELADDEVIAQSKLILDKLLAHPFLQKERVIASYMGFKGEIDTKHINDYLIKHQHIVSLPLIHPQKKGLMDFYKVNDIKNLVPNRYGILEPIAKAANLIPINLFELVIVPLVAFDKNGNRLGMGGGYYDRLLKKLSFNCITIGLAYDFQQIDKIEYEPWDMPLDEIITPTQHLRFTNKY